MPKTKKLQNQIAEKIDKLQELIDKFDDVRAINSDDPKTWDSDTLYDLVEQLKETLQLLEDQPIKGKTDEFGQPLYEAGLCSLVDSYHAEEEEEVY